MPISEYGILRLGVQPLSMLPLHVGYQLAKFTMSALIASTIISFKDQKRFERFTHLGPPRFSGVIGEDAYEFLIDYLEKLLNLGSLESHGISYTTYQLRDAARDWWRSLVSCKPLDSP